jgi:hypothetical protein
MRVTRRKVWLIAASAAAVAIGVGFAVEVQDRHAKAERERRYQAVLAQYAVELKPGMTREQVETYLHINGKGVRQMCCVASFKGEYVSLDQAAYDDLVRIATESAPWVCSENNVYIAFQFNPKSQSESSNTNGSDILKRISVFHQLEGCL